MIDDRENTQGNIFGDFDGFGDLFEEREKSRGSMVSEKEMSNNDGDVSRKASLDSRDSNRLLVASKYSNDDRSPIFDQMDIEVSRPVQRQTIYIPMEEEIKQTIVTHSGNRDLTPGQNKTPCSNLRVPPLEEQESRSKKMDIEIQVPKQKEKLPEQPIIKPNSSVFLLPPPAKSIISIPQTINKENLMNVARQPAINLTTNIAKPPLVPLQPQPPKLQSNFINNITRQQPVPLQKSPNISNIEHPKINIAPSLQFNKLQSTPFLQPNNIQKPSTISLNLKDPSLHQNTYKPLESNRLINVDMKSVKMNNGLNIPQEPTKHIKDQSFNLNLPGSYARQENPKQSSIKKKEGRL